MTGTKIRSFWAGTIIVTAFIVATAQIARSQVLYGSIVGNVKDASEAAVAGATVTVTNSETNFTRQTVTNESGSYDFVAVPGGIYVLKVSKEGFTTYTLQRLQVTINNPVLHEVPLVGKYFDIGAVRMSGSGTTVKQTSRTLAPSMRMNADLADWEHSELNLPIGESGHVASRHYRDQWDAYYNGKSFPMQFRKVEVKSTVHFVPHVSSKK